MFFALALSLVVLAVAVSGSVGPQRAIWLVWWPSLLLPSHIALWVGPVEITLPTVAGLALLACAMSGPARERARWLLSDYLLLGLIASGMVSEFVTDGGIASCLDVARRWGIPYLLGRVALAPSSGRTDARVTTTAVSVMASVCGAAALLAVFEALTQVNPYWRIAGYEWEYLVRYGIRRASGPAEHAIGFGMFFVCLLPAALEGWRRAGLGLGPLWWRWLPVLTAAGLFCTVSRGAWLGAALAICILVALQRPRYRKPMAVAAAMGAVLFWTGWDDIKSGLNALAGNDESSQEERIYMNGEVYTYNGTNHRYLQFIVYQRPIQETGFVGHGNKGMLRFSRAAQKQEFVPGIPSNVPGSFYSIDSHYLFMLLCRGWLGIGFWVALSLCCVAYVAKSPADDDQFLHHAVAGALLGVMLGLLTVYLHKPFEEAFIFLLGSAAAWHLQALRGRYRSEPAFEWSTGGDWNSQRRSPVEPQHREGVPTLL